MYFPNKSQINSKNEKLDSVIDLAMFMQQFTVLVNYLAFCKFQGEVYVSLSHISFFLNVTCFNNTIPSMLSKN